MKTVFAILPLMAGLTAWLLITGACTPVPGKNIPEKTADLKKGAAAINKDTHRIVVENADPEELWEVCYLVVADTGRDYMALRSVMNDIRELTGQEIDTMGRYYDAARDSIRLPDDDEDEMYAGQYYPRYVVNPAQSIEYLDIYRDHEEPGRTLVAVAGIFYDKSAADSTLALLSGKFANARVMKSKVYLGCMH